MIGSRLGNRVLVFFVDKGVPQRVLLEDEEKQIVEINQRTVKNPLASFKVGLCCQIFFLHFYICVNFAVLALI